MKSEANSSNFNISLAINISPTAYFRVLIINQNICTMLSLNLDPIFKVRGIESPHTALVKAGIHSSTAKRILYGNVRSFRLDHIEILCRILICEPHDLLL